MSKIISSFNEIELSNDLKYLIICDIDGTILYFPDCDKFCKELIDKVMCQTDEDYDEELKLLRMSYKRFNLPTHTDYNGFANMIEKINKTNSKLIFLTARSLEDYVLTKTHLKQIGVSSDDFEIHYTCNRIRKGEYIKKYLDLSVFDSVIFIDDNEKIIKTVLEINSEIVCYRFNASL